MATFLAKSAPATTQALVRRRGPRRTPIRPVRRSWLSAWWQARLAVNGGVPLEDFVRFRLTRYVAELPVAATRLPIVIAVDHEGQVVTSGAEPRGDLFGPKAIAPGAAVVGKPGWQALREAEGAELGRELAAARAEVGAVDERIAAAESKAARLRAELENAVAEGVVIAAPELVDATPEQRGRPAVPHPSPAWLCLGVAAVLFLVESWQIAVPWFRAVGLDPARLGGEIQRDPLAFTRGVLFAAGASAVLFAFARFGLHRLGELVALAEPERRRRSLASLAGAAAALAALLSGAVAALPAGPAEPAGGALAARGALFLVLLLLPVATAWLVLQAGELNARRAAAIADALAWDRAQCERLTERARCTAMIDEAEDQVAALDQERSALARRVERLDARLREVERRETQVAAAEEQELSRLAQTLVGALELDRFEFLRQASSRTAAALTRVSKERPAAERGSRHDGAVPVQADKSLGLAS